MDAKQQGFQVVQVVSHCRLLDAQSREQIYWRSNGLGLAKGWYGVTWPAGAVIGRFNEIACFHGPYPTRAEASSAMVIGAEGDAAPEKAPLLRDMPVRVRPESQGGSAADHTCPGASC